MAADQRVGAALSPDVSPREAVLQNNGGNMSTLHAARALLRREVGKQAEVE